MYKPRFVITNKILRWICQAEVAKEIILTSPLIPAWEVKFREDAAIRAVHHGTHIEGNELTIGEVKGALQGREVVARERDIQEVFNYRNIVKYIDKWSEGAEELSKPIDLGTVFTLHKISMEKMLPEERLGVFRDVDVVLKNSRTFVTSYKPPSKLNVPALMKFFLDWLNSDLAQEVHPVLRAGIVHYELARIHPFVDGNGRVGRALATLVLFKSGFDTKRFFSLEEFYDKNAARYYEALQHASNQLVVDESERDLTFWLEFFSEGLAVELSRVKERVKKLSVDLKLAAKIGQVTLNERQVTMVEYMEDYGSINNSEWRNLLPDYSDDTLLRDMNDLIEKGLVKKEGKTKAAKYILVK
jgi:Fic family protein